MKQLDPSQPRRATKEVGLREFQRTGWLLVDATYEPVNKLDKRSAARVIERDYPLLRDDLATMTPDRSVPLVLIKKNICKVLEPKLTGDGFKVLNRGCLIPFPASGQQKKFHEQFGAIIARTRLKGEKAEICWSPRWCAAAVDKRTRSSTLRPVLGGSGRVPTTRHPRLRRE